MTATTTMARPVSQRSAGCSAARSLPVRLGSNAGTPLSQRGYEPDGDEAIEGDGQQEQKAGDGLVPEGRDAEDVQRGLNRAEQEGPDGRADGAAASAEDRHTADHHRGAHGLLLPGPRGGIDGFVLCGPEHPGQPGDGTADREGGKDPLADGDSGQESRFRVRPDRVKL